MNTSVNFDGLESLIFKEKPKKISKPVRSNKRSNKRSRTVEKVKKDYTVNISDRKAYNISKRFYKYKITNQDYINILEKQDNCCAICKIKFDDIYKYFVDHNHNSGEIRGILCKNCNMGLGKFKDNINMLQNATNYLIEKGSYG